MPCTLHPHPRTPRCRCKTIDRCFPQARPSGHSTHDPVPPSPLLYDPTGHGMHAPDPFVALKRPSPQAVHAAPSTPSYP
eukprot:735887-Rhodomonas_salina.1